MILAIQIQRYLNCREGVIIRWLGVTDIGGYLTERYFWRGFSGTAMSVCFGLGEGPTTVNKISVTVLNYIINPSFVSLDIFSVLHVHINYDFLGYQRAAIMPFITMRLCKRYDLT